MREMKDSGIEWIGEIPSNSLLTPLKYLSCIIRGGSPRPIANFLTDEVNGYNWIKIGDTVKNSKYITKTKFKIKPSGLNNTRLVKKGSLLLTNSMSFGEPYILQIDGCIHDGWVSLFDFRNINQEYLYYCLISNVCRVQFERLTDGGVVQNLNIDKIASVKVVLFNLAEQERIVKFLDTQCSEIDATAEDIQKEISLLEDYKKSVITEAVTKGLNPDAEMKDSKIFYLGQINKNWNLSKVGYCCKKLYRSFEPSDEALICSNKGKVVPRGDTLIGLMTSDDNAMQGICKGDIAIHGMDTWHGAIACSDYDGKITRVVHVCKADGDNRFVAYWLQHLAFVGVYKLISNGVRGNTSDFRSWDKVADIYVPDPIKEEQKQIADFLDSKCSEIDTLIADKKRQLDILADYKKSLIYEYVTGKKEVV